MTLVKADLGTKRACPSCGARFYDLQKRPIECPKCAFKFEPEALYKQRRPRQPEPAEAVEAAETDEEEVEETETEDVEEAIVAEEDTTALEPLGDDEEEEEVEETEVEGPGMTVVEDEDVIEDLDDEDLAEEDDDALLAEVEDDEDDVSGIIDADIEKDER